MKYQLLFSIPIHERLEVVIDQILNIKHCNPDSAIVFHLSQGYKDANSFLSKESFIQIIEKIGDVYLNPVSVRTGMDDIIQAHLENYSFIKEKIDFEYFCICASNESFIKKGLYESIKSYDGGASQDGVNGWLYEKELEEDDDFQHYLESIGNRYQVHTYPEGQFFKKDVFEYIAKEIASFFDHTTIKTAYPRDEVYFATFLGILGQKDTCIKIGPVFTYSAYHLTHLWNVTRLRIVLELNKRKDIYSIKRVDRNINDSVRAYLRQTLGYLDEEKELLDGICSIDRYSNTQIDWMDIKKLINPVFKNLDSVWSRIGLKPPKKGKINN